MKTFYIVIFAERKIILVKSNKTGMDLYHAINAKLGHDDWDFVQEIFTETIEV